MWAAVRWTPSVLLEFLYLVAGYRMFATVSASSGRGYDGPLWPPDGVGPLTLTGGGEMVDTLETLVAKQAITEVLHRYCYAMDRIDPELGAQIWHAMAWPTTDRRSSRARPRTT